jgi:hypothetical protein
MNLALSAIILIILLLPGAISIKAYYSSFKVKKSNIAIPFNDLIIKGLAISFLLHSAGLSLLHLFNQQINLLLLYNMIAGRELAFTDTQLLSSFLQFSVYNTVLIVFAWGAAKLFKNYVGKKKIDINYYSFRNTNYWYYVFSARYLEGKSVPGEQRDTDLIFLDILTTADIIYSGLLLDFNYSPEKDALENIILNSTAKRAYQPSAEEKEQYPEHTTGSPSRVEGDAFIIPMSLIRNINITYIGIEEVS